jgi:hypothetical protein
MSSVVRALAAIVKRCRSRQAAGRFAHTPQPTPPVTDDDDDDEDDDLPDHGSDGGNIDPDDDEGWSDEDDEDDDDTGWSAAGRDPRRALRR